MGRKQTLGQRRYALQRMQDTWVTRTEPPDRAALAYAQQEKANVLDLLAPLWPDLLPQLHEAFSNLSTASATARAYQTAVDLINTAFEREAEFTPSDYRLRMAWVRLLAVGEGLAPNQRQQVWAHIDALIAGDERRINAQAAIDMVREWQQQRKLWLIGNELKELAEALQVVCNESQHVVAA